MDFDDKNLNCDTSALQTITVNSNERLRFLSQVDALRLGSGNWKCANTEMNIHSEGVKATPNIQCTSADGFFNRKRGRPPKNRFVQVYKNLQPDRTPQAVFTSFKLEKQVNPTTNIATETQHAAANQLEIVEIEGRKSPIPDNKLRQIEKCRFSALNELERKSQLLDFYRKETAREQKLVRSTGTFFPTHNTDNKYANASFPEVARTSEMQPAEIPQEMPEDLSIRRKDANEKNASEALNPEGLTYSYLQMYHLLNLYRQAQQLPNLLRAHDYGESPAAVEQTPQTTSSTMSEPASRLSSSEKSMPFGYSRYRYSEDCGLPRCGYRQRQTHFHCDRNDCQYSFCDRARFFQHTARHKRLDALLANDFKHFRPNVDCHYANCAQVMNLSKKSSSHFHCLRCSFVCYETNKFSSHRRLHSKLSYFKKIGFRKFVARENCGALGVNSCIFNRKQTHYHCLICDFSVLSKAQFIGHSH